MPEKLPMPEDLRQYLKDEFGFDTRREGMRAVKITRNMLVTEP